MMLKILIIGCPGAGKSTFARKLKKATHLPLFYLDMLWHKPDKTTVSREVFDIRLRDILRQDRWIIDGNYLRTLKMRVESCDTVFFLDFPPDVCLSGAASRIGKQREDLPWVESSLEQEFQQQILDFPKNELPQISKLLQNAPEKNIIIFHSREELDDYLKKFDI